MGYDLHITRRKDWSTVGDDISSDEWLALIASDPELSLESQNGPFFAIWSGPSTLSQPWLDWSNGQISTKNPDEALIDKMIEIARILKAGVQGDDGEFHKSSKYHPQVDRISTFQLILLRLHHLVSRFFSRPKLPPPSFKVGDRVGNATGEPAIVKDINRRANFGYGEVRVKYDDGRELTYFLFGHCLSKVDEEECGENQVQ